MTTPEQEKPTEGPFSKIEALTDDVFNSLPPEVTKLDTEYPVRYLYFKDISAIAMLQEDLSPESIMSLQDEVRNLEAKQQAGFYELEPKTVLGRWLKKRQKRRDAAKPPVVINDEQTSVVEIIEPLHARSQSVRMKTYPDCFAYSIEKIGFSGRLMVDGRDVELNPDESLITVDKMKYDPDDVNGFIYPDGQEHYVLVLGSKKIYRPRSASLGYYGTPLVDAKEVNSALESMGKILGEIKNAQNPRNW